MERLIIIDHDSHTCFIDDISDEVLEKYNGEEEDYIKDNYSCLYNYSWDYVTRVEYIPEDDKDRSYEVNPEELI